MAAYIISLQIQAGLLPLRALIMVLSINVTFVPLCVDFDKPGDYFLFIFHMLAGVSTVLVAGSVACGILNTRSLLIQHRFLFMLNTSICDTLTGCGIFYQFLFDVRVDFPSKNGIYYILPSLLGVNIMTEMVPLNKAIEIAVYSRISLMVIIITKISMTVKLLVVARYQMHREPPGPERDSKKESLLIIIVVVALFLLLWGPSMLYTIVSSLTGKYADIKNDAVNPMKILSRSNALCTPSLYLWASPSLRAAVWKTVWSKICCCKEPKRTEKVGAVTWKISH